jgi:hypothetical protein
MHLLRFPKNLTFDRIDKVIDFARGHLNLNRESETIGRIGGVFSSWVTGPDGEILVPPPLHPDPNTLTNEGANWIREIIFKGTSAPAASALYIGLMLDSTTPAVTTALANIASFETVSNGYSRKNVTAANWNIATQGQANNTASPVTQTASGGTLCGAAVNEAFICDAASGTSGHLLCYATQTNAPFTVTTGSSLNTTYTWTVA